MKVIEQTATRLVFQVQAKHEVLVRQIFFAFMTGSSIFRLLDIARNQINYFNISLSTVWDINTYLVATILWINILVKFDLYVPEAYIFDKDTDKFIIRYWYWFKTKVVEYSLHQIVDVNIIRSPIGASAPKLTLAASKPLILYSFWTLVDFNRQKVQKIVDRIRSFLILQQAIAGDRGGGSDRRERA